MKLSSKLIAALFAVLTAVCVVVAAAPEARAAEPTSGVTAELARLGGADRTETADMIADEGWASADTAFLANGFTYADALAGAPLAYAYNAPILLTQKEYVPRNVMSELQKLGVRNVYLLGGTAAISADVESYLKQNNITVTRIWGATRYETAVEIAKALKNKGVQTAGSGEVFIASGVNYPDALAASPVAAIKGSPILYAPKSGELDSATADYIKNGSVGKAYILGGEAAVGSAVNGKLSGAGVASTQRIGGADRYETAVLIAKNFDSVFTSRDVAFATGRNFPDALAGGVFAAKKSVPVILTDNVNVNGAAKDYIAGKDPAKAYIFGGAAVVSDENVRAHLPSRTAPTSSTTASTTASTTTTTSATSATTATTATTTKIAPAPAGKYAVVFSGNGSYVYDVPGVQYVDKDKTAVKPAAPKREGYDFTGWFTDAAANEPFDFNTKITGDITLYAGWEAISISGITYDVIFSSEGDVEHLPVYQVVERGMRAEYPDEDPTREGYLFWGWYADQECTENYDFETRIYEPTVIWAGWLKIGDFKFEWAEGSLIPKAKTGSRYTVRVVAEEGVEINSYGWYFIPDNEEDVERDFDGSFEPQDETNTVFEVVCPSYPGEFTLSVDGYKDDTIIPLTQPIKVTAAQPTGLLYDENGVPYIFENFNNDTYYGDPRGGVTLTQADDNNPGEEDDKSLTCSGRTDTWNGINFGADPFAGNTVNISADLSGTDSSLRISAQYDVGGNTSYVWVAPGAGSAEPTRFSGQVSIPEGAENVIVYVESDGLGDITVDNLSVTVEGEYKKPGSEPIEYADYSGYPELKSLYSQYFTFGCAVPVSFVEGENQEYIKLVTKEFSTVTLENELKPEGILDYDTSVADLDKYNESPALDFSQIKSTLDYCAANGIKVRGHTLLWHSQTPEWLFYKNYDKDGELADRELMLKRMENYIKNVFTWAQTNYPGLFIAWDVVNEACDDSTFQLRQLNWYNTVGPDYLEKAFEYARKYAPDGVKLFYNDYNSYQTAKRDGIIAMLKPVAEAGNIDGVGMQSHIGTTVNIEGFIESAKKYADELGVVIHITELDVTMPRSKNPEYDQGVFFQDFFTALIDAKKAGLPLENVTVWGICDPLSWKASEKPVLFNGDLSKKLAFDGVVAAVSGGEVAKPDDYVEPGPAAPISEDFEDGTYKGYSRAGSGKVEVVSDDAYEGGKCVRVSGSTQTWDGYAFDVSDYIGKKMKFSFAVKSTADHCKFSANIDGSWPMIAGADTSSGEWVYCEGIYDVPGDLAELSVYFESDGVTDDIYVDAIKIEPVEDVVE